MSHRYNTRLQANKKKVTPVLERLTPIHVPAPEPLNFAQEQHEKDLAVIRSILDRVGNTKKERMLNVIELFQYLVWNPLMLKHTRFRMTAEQKIKEFEQDSANERTLLKFITSEQARCSGDYIISVAQNVGLFDCIDSLSKQLKNVIKTY